MFLEAVDFSYEEKLFFKAVDLSLFLLSWKLLIFPYMRKNCSEYCEQLCIFFSYKEKLFLTVDLSFFL
jgi:hypothetical protein